jgi:hypothetical protein
MKPYEPDKPDACPKCGYDRAYVGWCNMGHGYNDPTTHEAIQEGQEHFHRECVRCHYRWVEGPVQRR